VSISTAVRITRRCRCTGESPNTVRRQREPLQPGVLVPSASSRPQRELEAAILLAATRMSGRGLPMIKWVGPDSDSLRLKIAHDAVASFFAEALPVVVDGEVTGIPGLRPWPGRDHVDFRVIGLDGDSQAAVRLMGVSRTQYRNAAELLSRAEVQLWRECRNSLHAREADLVHDLATQPVDLMSGVLRRFALFRGATSIASVVDGDALRVQWCDGPDGEVIASILGESECRIPGAVVRSLRLVDGVHLALAPLCECSVQDEPEWAWVRLEVTSSPRTGQLLEASSTAPANQLRSVFPSPDLWEKPDMRAALANKEISQVYRLLRKHGISQRQIAAQTGQSQSEVSEILKGRQVTAHDVLARIATSLGVPRGYMGVPCDEETRVRIVAPGDDQTPEETESVKRRNFLAHAAAVALGANVFGADSGPSVSTPIQRPTPGYIGMTDVRQVEAATRALRSLDYQYGDGFCRDAVIAQLSWGQQMLDASATDMVKQRLHIALADLHNLAAKSIRATTTGPTTR
jgi:transcriptional regulator with XRE-family HTH domain